jgi:hypothetical protein
VRLPDSCEGGQKSGGGRMVLSLSERSNPASSEAVEMLGFDLSVHGKRVNYIHLDVTCPRMLYQR